MTLGLLISVSILRRAWNCGFFTSQACFAHFTWQRLQPLPVRQLYDTVGLTVPCIPPESDAECSLAKEKQRSSSFPHSNPSSAMGTIMYVRSSSRTTAVFKISQLDLLSCPFRYAIIEDFGPVVYAREDWPKSSI